MFSTDAPQPASEESRPSTPLSPLGAIGVALATAALVFALGVYAVEQELPAWTARRRGVPPATAAVTGFARLAVAASLRVELPVAPGAPPAASAIDGAAGPDRPMPSPPPSAEAASPPPQPSAETAPPPLQPDAEAASPTPSAETAPPPPQPNAEAAPPPPQPSAEAASPPPQPSAEATASAPPRPRPGYGLLQLNAAQNATVYVTGVAVGPSNQPLEVRCGRFFVRLGEPTRHGTRWLAEGRTVVIKCGAMTEVSF